MELQLTIGELLEYTDWLRARARAWFLDHTDALRASTGPHGDGRFTTVGDLVKHVFSAEHRYAQRVRGESLADLSHVPSDDVGALFAAGDAARDRLVELLRTFPEDRWSTPCDYEILQHRITVPPKKIVVHVLMHEIRHWAQIATLCRLSGYAPDFQDFLASPVWSTESLRHPQA